MKPFLYGLIGLLLVLSVQGQGGNSMTLDTNFYVVGTEDWEGNLTVQVVDPMAFAELKKETALDNEALLVAFQNLKNDWKAEHSKVVTTTTTTTTEPKPKVPPFPLKHPMPKVFHFYGKLPTTAAAEEKKAFYEEREAARLKRLEADKERSAKFSSGSKKSDWGEKASIRAEMWDNLQAEIVDVKAAMAMGVDPRRKRDSENASSTTGGKKVTVKQGARLGEGAGQSLVKEGHLVNDGELGKIDKRK